MILTNKVTVSYWRILPDGSKSEIKKESNTVTTNVFKKPVVITYHIQTNENQQNNTMNVENLLYLYAIRTLLRRIESNTAKIVILLIYTIF